MKNEVVKMQDLMMLYDIRYARDPKNIHYQKFLKNAPKLMRTLEAWNNKAANDDHFDSEHPALNK